MTKASRKRIRYGYSRRKTRVGLIPLVDVVFILVIFFMLASSFSRYSAVAVTPPPPSAPSVAIPHRSITITILGNAMYEFAGSQISSEELAHLLADARQARLTVSLAESCTLQDMIDFIELAAIAGRSDYSFTTTVAVMPQERVGADKRE